jgi:hypothetical protein
VAVSRGPSHHSAKVMEGKLFTTKQAARKIGISPVGLYDGIRPGKIAAPPYQNIGGHMWRGWSAEDIER